MSDIEVLGTAWRPLVERVLAEFPGAEPDGSSPLAALGELLDRVVEWNRRADLTAARSAEELVDLFVADAACLAVQVPPGVAQRWIDVGSGAGAPALALAVLRPRLELHLVEPRTKRVAFLRTAVGALGLGNVEVQRARSNEVADGSADVALSRATLPPEQWLKEGSRLATHAVWVLLAREAAPRTAGWQSARDLSYRWPLTDVRRRAVEFVPVGA